MGLRRIPTGTNEGPNGNGNVLKTCLHQGRIGAMLCLTSDA